MSKKMGYYDLHMRVYEVTRIYDPYTDELLPIKGVLTEVSMESHMVSIEAVTHDLKNIKQIMQKHGSDVTFNGK